MGRVISQVKNSISIRLAETSAADCIHTAPSPRWPARGYGDALVDQSVGRLADGVGLAGEAGEAIEEGSMSSLGICGSTASWA